MQNLTLIRAVHWRAGIRSFSTLPEVTEHAKPKVNPGRMTGWQIHSYSEDLQLAQNIKKPIILKPTQLLVKVTASSVNPIDVAMMSENTISRASVTLTSHCFQMVTDQRFSTQCELDRAILSFRSFLAVISWELSSTRDSTSAIPSSEPATRCGVSSRCTIKAVTAIL